MTNAAHAIIVDRHCGEDQLRQAIQGLGPVSEPPSFWTAIASDDSYSRFHRRQSVFQLFYRHIRPGMTLADLARVVGQPTWLSRINVTAVEDLGGHIPVALSSDRTVLVFDILPDPMPNSDHWQVYLSVTGAVDPGDVIRLLSGERVPETVHNAHIIEIGFSPPALRSGGGSSEPVTKQGG